MSDTAKLVNQMFVNLVKLRLDDRIAKQAASVVDGVVEKVLGESPEATDETRFGLMPRYKQVILRFERAPESPFYLRETEWEKVLKKAGKSGEEVKKVDA